MILAIKSLCRSPGFTLIAIVTLGLGIGANTSMFSILNGYLLRPAPYADRDRLDRIYRATRQDSRGGFSPADYLDLKSEMSGYGEIAAYTSSDMSLSEPGKPAEMAQGLRISANLFSTLGTTPQLGRSFRPDEEISGNHRVLIISHRYWENRFGGDDHIIGRTVRVDSEPYEIVGVLPATFSDWRHLSWVDIFRPLGLSEKEIRDRNLTRLRLVGRRSATLPRAQAEAFIASFGRRLARDFPAANADSTWRTVPIDDSFIDKDGPPIIGMLVGLSGFVLLIACSNLANLFLARTMGRAREFAVRSALGASRSQVLRPLMVESLLLAFAGGICAVFVALWTFDWFAVVSAEPGGNGVGVDFSLDWHVLGWMFGACLFTALAFGVAPAHFVRKLDLNSTLKSGSRGTTGDRGHRRFRHVLIVSQFAFAMVLLAGAALFVRGIHEINNRRLLSGRTFNEGDTLTAPRVFIINQAMARGLFAGESPLGRRIAQAGGKTPEWGEIVGVVGDVESVYANRITVRYQLYQPMAQEARPFNELAVRIAGIAPSTVVDGIRTTMAALDPDLPVCKLQPAVTTIAWANYQDGVLGSVLSALAVLGLGLASLGVYGVIARTVAQRTGEFGIRLALGAQAGDITRLVLTSGTTLALIGCALGLLGAFGISRLLAAAFPGMQMSSVPVLIGTTVLLIAIAQIAGYIPARYASRINPIETLRAE